MLCRISTKRIQRYFVYRAIVFKREDMDKYAVLILPYGIMTGGYEKDEAERLKNIAQSLLDILKKNEDLLTKSDNENI